MVVILLVILFMWWGNDTEPVVIENQAVTPVVTATSSSQNKAETVLGTSVQGRPIMAYHFGTGPEEVLLVGGIHGGYEWNTALLAYDVIDYLKANPSSIPAKLTVTVVPVLNPDGLALTVGTSSRFALSAVPATEAATIPGRFNANNVDLNRNFACEWSKTGKWQSRTVSGGTSAFSEPESLAVKNYVEKQNLEAVIVWYSAAGGVYASACGETVSADTMELTNIYAKASGYPAYDEFDAYTTSGDMVNWLASKNIPAISVLLTNHTSTEWSKNWAGLQAVFKQLAN